MYRTIIYESVGLILSCIELYQISPSFPKIPMNIRDCFSNENVRFNDKALHLLINNKMEAYNMEVKRFHMTLNLLKIHGSYKRDRK